MGTTNTRAWLVRGDEVLAHERRSVGVRDASRTGSAAPIEAALREVIAALQAQAPSNCDIECVAAAGMIGSALGLAEVAHVAAPAGVAELAAAARWIEASAVTKLPFLIVPGVRSTIPPSEATESRADRDAARNVSTCDNDVMRGEETLCLGLALSGRVQAPCAVLNLGSHWKAIQLDESGRIAGSFTTLSGEMMHACRTQTVLSRSVKEEMPPEVETAPGRGRPGSNSSTSSFDAGWLEAGMREQRRSGLARALFCVRLLDLGREGSAEERLASLVGAFIAADLDAFLACGLLNPNTRAAITGSAALAAAWRSALAPESISAEIISPEDAEAAWRRGIGAILARALARADAGDPRASRPRPHKQNNVRPSGAAR